MATYIENLTLPFARTGVTGQYPLLVKSSTFAPDCTLFVKAGDTVRYVVTQDDGSGSTGTIGYANTTNTDTDPDPTVTSSQSSPATWERTVGTSTEDRYFDWYFFGSVDFDFGSGKKYSQKLTTIRVDGTPRMNGGTSAITVAQGGTITFSVTGFSMFDANANAQLTAGTNSNRLYFAVFNSNGSLVGVHNYTGGGWDSSSNQLGRVHSGDTSTVLTVGSNFPTGTYSVYLSHYNGADSPTTNDFYGTENRLGANGLTGSSASALQFTVAADDVTPDSFSIGNDQTVTTSGEYNATQFTVSGINAAATVSVSGDGSPSVSIAGGTRISGNTTTTVTDGQTVDFKMFGPATPGANHSATLNIGTGSASIQLTAAASGGSQGGASGTSDYGLSVLGPPSGGTQPVIFSPNFKITNLVAFGIESNIQNGSPRTVPSSGVFEGLSSSDDKVKILFLLDNDPLVAYALTVTKNTGSGEGTVTFTNIGAGNINLKYYVLRTE